ncbi:MAG TPA: GH25 family lysozyme [Verrucomicrobiae bacterium]|nr:GH25 family lysozyme [Verrucomicrobiae bacterium]
MKTLSTILVLSLAAISRLCAQLVNDGATNVLSNITNNTANITIGTNGSFTLLVLSNNTLLNNTVTAVIGRNASAQSNEVHITGATARWNIGAFGSLFVGSNGPSSRLTVSDGGTLQGFFFGNVGQGLSSSNNSVFVTDPGSVFSGGLLLLGGGGGHQLTVSNGATAWIGGTTVGLGASSNNLVTIIGAGSLLTNDTGLTLASSGNRVMVSAGGALANINSTLGVDSSSSHNTVLLTDSGSGWTNSGYLRIGDSGIGNQVIVSNGAVIYVGNNAFVGFGSTGYSNSLILTDPDTRFLRGLNTGLTIGSNSPFNQLVISNGAFVSSVSGMLGLNAGGSNNTAMVTGPGSVWTNEQDCYVGNLAAGNRLVLSNGAAMYAGRNSGIGIESGARANSVVVTDADTRWLITSNLYVGSNGPFNRLTVTNGARVENGLGVIGARISCNSNEVVVTGAGSIWTNSDWLYVGRNGAFNRLVVTNGGHVQSFGGWIGEYVSFVGPTNADNNEVIVTGTGSLWQLGFGSLFVGDARNTGNRLVVSNGASMLNSICYIGFQSTNNFVLVTGPGSTWSNSNFIALGQGGGGNRLLVTNGGLVFANSFECGFGGTAGNNLLRVDDGVLRTAAHPATGRFDVHVATTMLNSGLADIGLLLLTNSQGRFEFNGGTLITRSATINNGVPFTVGRGGAVPAIWDVRSNSINHVLAGRLIVGSNASFNQVFITNGATLTSGEYTFLAFSSGSNNAVTVSGPGSTFDSSSGFFIGADGNANRMLISNGGKAIASVGNSGTFIGRSTGTRSNLVVVTDPDSRWSVNDILYVGGGGNANLLVVSNGATMDSLVGYVGSATSGSNNLAIITGANSSWSNRSEFYVGSSGSGNRLVVSEGGTLISSNAFLAMDLSSRSNSVLVTGAGSRWNSRADLAVGYDGTDNQLVVSNGAVVSVFRNLFLGLNPTTSSGNRIVVDGGTLVVTNTGVTGLLEIKRGTNVLNAGLIETDILRMTNAQSTMEFNGGTLSVKSSRVSIGNPLIIGDGTNPATFFLAGNGTHDFGGTLGLILTNNATLSGNGTVLAQLQVRTGAKLAPGAPLGKINLSSSPFIFGSIEMEISKNGATLTNDQIQLNNNGALTYSGALIVTNLGPSVLLPGDRFQLFIAGSYSGTFASLTLPSLPATLSWTNKLSVDGSIEVVEGLTRPFGVDVSHFQNESGIPQASWDQMYADGKQFVFVKATEGLTGPHDPTMALNVQRASTAGLLVGVYHYAHPENRPTTNGAILEASNMVVYAGSAIGPGRLRPVIDLEGSAATLSTAALTDWVIAFSNEIIARRGPGAAPIIYCNQTFANNELDNRVAGYDLWLRTVGSGADPAVDDPPGAGFADATGVFDNWSFWQYSASGSSGGISPLDLDVCHEEYKPLASFLITNVPLTPIQLTGLSLTANGAFQFSFTNAPGAWFTVLATTNVATPLSNWTVLGPTTETAPGQFQFSDAQITNHSQRYYRVQSP